MGKDSSRSNLRKNSPTNSFSGYSYEASNSHSTEYTTGAINNIKKHVPGGYGSGQSVNSYNGAPSTKTATYQSSTQSASQKASLS